MQVDISMIGDEVLQRRLSNLVGKTQKKIVRQALRKEAKETKKRIVSNIKILGLIDSGTMLQAYQNTKVRSTSKRNFIRLGPENPKRDELGIRANDKYYYPYAVEFGHAGAKAHPFIRPAVDEYKTSSIKSIGRDIGSGIEREGRK